MEHAPQLQHSVSHERNFWVDVIRGLALLVMSVDHVEEMCGLQVASYITYAPIGITTATEVFILLSGYSFGLAYTPTYFQHGLPMLYLRCSARALQLLVMHVFCLVITVAIVTWLSGVLAGITGAAMVPPVRVTNEMLSNFVVFIRSPKYFDILPLYIIFLLTVPALMPLISTSRSGLLVSIGVYLCVQVIALAPLNVHLPFSNSLYYNPLAWQLLFVVGMSAAIWPLKRLQACTARFLVPAIISLAIVGVWYKGIRVNHILQLFPSIGGDDWRRYDVPFSDKSTLGPLRIAHFLVLSALILAIKPFSIGGRTHSALSAVALVGRNGLEAFVASVCLAYVASTFYIALGGGLIYVLLMDSASVAILFAVAYAAALLKRKPWKAASSRTRMPRSAPNEIGADVPVTLLQ